MIFIVMSVRTVVRIEADACTVSDVGMLTLTQGGDVIAGGNVVATFHSWDWVGKEQNTTVEKEQHP